MWKKCVPLNYFSFWECLVRVGISQNMLKIRVLLISDGNPCRSSYCKLRWGYFHHGLEIHHAEKRKHHFDEKSHQVLCRVKWANLR